jgi:hypothetical protein
VAVAVEEARIEGRESEPDQPRPSGAVVDLEAVVREELREPVAELVRRLVLDLAREEVERIIAASLNGGPEPMAEDPPESPQEPQDATGALDQASATGETFGGQLKRCRGCGKSKPAATFTAGRRECPDCRRERKRKEYRRARARAEEANGSETSPG